MTEHLVDHYLQPEPMGLGQQLVEILQRAEQWIDIPIVSDVIAEIGHRRLEEGCNPDGVHAQAGHVIESVDDTRQVTYPTAIGIKKTARIDLIGDSTAPPA
jgi:hypothetical protein